MSTDLRRPPCRSLGQYVTELVGRLAAADPAAYGRLRTAVGGRRARIGLDDETVDVAFVGATLRVTAPRGGVDGQGATDRACVADLLGGYSELASAVLDGRLQVRGDADAVAAIVTAIEVLLDAAPRVPALQQLARDFLADPCRPVPPARLPGDVAPVTRWAPGTSDAEELRLLGRLDLLPDPPADPGDPGASAAPVESLQ